MGVVVLDVLAQDDVEVSGSGNPPWGTDYLIVIEHDRTPPQQAGNGL